MLDDAVGLYHKCDAFIILVNDSTMACKFNFA